jgi:uncharacterized protein
MAADSVLARLEAEFDTPGEAIREIVAHLEHGAPPLYITRYRSDRIDGTHLDRVREIADRLQSLQDIENRRQSLRDSARARQMATPELEKLIDETTDTDVLDDVHHMLRRRPSRWERLYEAVRPLADAIQQRQLGDLDLRGAAAEYVDPNFAPSGPFGDGVVEEEATQGEDAAGGEAATATTEADVAAIEPVAADASTVSEAPAGDAATTEPSASAAEAPAAEVPTSEAPADAAAPVETATTESVSATDTAPAPETSIDTTRTDTAPTTGGDAPEAAPTDGVTADDERREEEEEQEEAGEEAETPAAPESEATPEASASVEKREDDDPAGPVEAEGTDGAAKTEASAEASPTPEGAAAESAATEDATAETAAAETVAAVAAATETAAPEGAAPEGAEAPATQAAATAEASAEKAQADDKPARKAEREQAPSLGTPESVLEVVALVLSQRFADDMRLRARFRDELAKGELHVRPVAPDKKGAKRYAEFFDKSEPIRRISPQRMLKLRKAEREGIVKLTLDLAEGRAREVMRNRFSKDVDVESDLGQFLDAVYQHSFDTYIRPGCEKQVRQRIKERADREVLRAFTRSVRAQLLAPPLGAHDALVVRAAGKQVFVVHLGPDGRAGEKLTLASEKDEERAEAVAKIAEAIKPEFAAIAIPHGRREAAARSLVTEALAKRQESEEGFKAPPVYAVDETAAVVMATSAGGRRRMPNVEPGLRAAIALGRRLQDPLRELAHAEPRAFGLGAHLSEVHQGKLQRLIDTTTSECVATVGADINADPSDLLERVPGMTRENAKAIVQRRQIDGPFSRLRELEQMEGFGPDRFEYTGGFLRLRGSVDALDITAVHPSDYAVAQKLAEAKGCDVEALFGQRHRDVPLDDLIEEHRGRTRTLEALRAIALGTDDPRGHLEPLANEGLNTITDLALDKEYRGRVTNMTEFGAFIDVGIGSDGLVHVSQIPASRLRDIENPLRVGEVVTVYVQQVDPDKKKISLTMIKPRHLAEGRAPTLGERMGGSRGRGRRGEVEARTRAARAPDRQGGRRGGPGRGRGGEGAGAGGRGRGRGRGRDDDFRDGGRGRGGPRVMTFEPEEAKSKKAEKTRGHKGELKSLAGLRNLLGGNDESKS